MSDVKLNSPLEGLSFSVIENASIFTLKLTECSGDLLPALVKIEVILAKAGIDKLEIELSDALRSQTARLDKLQYTQLALDRFTKTVNVINSVRFSITEKCNFHCFFCHEEGMEMEVKRDACEYDEIFSVIAQFHQQNNQDFTFTGGEPLLQWRMINACLDYMQEIGYHPEITIVTNGERLNQKMIDRLLLFPAKVRFNFSIHSLEDKAYLDIVHRMKKPEVGNEMLLTRIKEKIMLLQQANLSFKFNIVLLKGINTSPQALRAILDYAAECGATSVKFLELLITEKLQGFYQYFYNLAAVEKDLKSVLTFSHQDSRRRTFIYGDTKLEVELQHCICAKGCNVCNLHRGSFFSAELQYFPCFLFPEKSLQLNATNLLETIDAGVEQIDHMAKYYQDNSPILIKEHYSTREEKAYYYAIDEQDVKRIKNLMETKQHRLRDFTEFYYHCDVNLAGAETGSTVEIKKLSLNTYENSYLEIHQNVSVGHAGLLHTQFLSDGRFIQDKARYEQELIEQGKHCLLVLNWHIDYFTSVNGDISISQNKETGSYILRSEKPFSLLNVAVTPLTQALPLFIKSALVAFKNDKEKVL